LPFQFLPSLATTIEYRFLGLAHRDYDFTTSVAPGVTTSGKLKFGNDFNHSLLIGVRYNFGAPTLLSPAAPTPTAAPAPAAARSYLVFFDWERPSRTWGARLLSETGGAPNAPRRHNPG
jgi:hypothetical protein